MSWLPLAGAGTTGLERALGLRPELLADYRAFEGRFWTGCIDPLLLELCRLRVAQILGGASELRRRTPAAAGLDERKAQALGRWQTSDAFSAVERAALQLTDGFVLDPHGVTDEETTALAAHLTPAEMVALIEALAVFDGFTRFRLILGVEEPR